MSKNIMILINVPPLGNLHFSYCAEDVIADPAVKRRGELGRKMFHRSKCTDWEETMRKPVRHTVMMQG